MLVTACSCAPCAVPCARRWEAVKCSFLCNQRSDLADSLSRLRLGADDLGSSETFRVPIQPELMELMSDEQRGSLKQQQHGLDSQLWTMCAAWQLASSWPREVKAMPAPALRYEQWPGGLTNAWTTGPHSALQHMNAYTIKCTSASPSARAGAAGGWVCTQPLPASSGEGGSAGLRPGSTGGGA
ncbi:hypothetical protein HaLaN_22201 [Haematococcus lacustris]|uniref:Uncharacterized protein n=1 Tax=Haematococcus lacustris TaxID=44745 RepID=A0A6A0A0J1_HAELA|nr:hypothetical protein HaLaN_22201 [Haematococcus lacustris]